MILKNFKNNTVVTSAKIEPVYNADFETAISATHFGKFNILLYLLLIPAGCTTVFETTTMAYVHPAAQCDLNLSLTDKGSLNAITFLGMISSGFIWGFLIDTLGRKKLLVVGYLLDGMFVVISSFSQNFIFLIVFKFLGGFIINGPFAALASYLSEFHCSKYRSRVQMMRGVVVAMGTMALPLLAWIVLPRKIHLEFFNGHIVMHSWNIYLLVCAFPSLISTMAFLFMPESPKFLMTMGRNEEALEVFQKVFSMNTGKNKEEYPVKSLIDETKLFQDTHITPNRSKKQAIKEGFQQIKPLCFPPHVKNAVLVCTIQTMFMFSVNTIRLWVPQIFQAISDYQHLHNGSTSSLCNMLDVLRPSEEKNATCVVNFSPSVYQNTMIISTVSISGYFLAGSVINKLGRKILLVILALIAGLCEITIYFAQNTATVLAMSSIFLGFGAVLGNILLTIAIDLFPTSLRTVAISLVMMSGRGASMIGNLMFPLLLELGCAPPFIFVGTVVISSIFLTVLLPKTDQQALR